MFDPKLPRLKTITQTLNIIIISRKNLRHIIFNFLYMTEMRFASTSYILLFFFYNMCPLDIKQVFKQPN